MNHAGESPPHLPTSPPPQGLSPVTPSPPHPITPSPAHVTYLTADLPGIGGRLRERPEDFFVEEQPLYRPSGAGEHIYLFIEKRNLATLAVVRLLSSHFGVREAGIGYAGLKDKRAVTRQVFSIHAPKQRLEDFPSIKDDRITVLWADRHGNKLRRGHLAGNRFVIRVRGTDAAKVVTARRALDRLARAGVPNRIGEQRFGYMRRNHLIGRAIVRQDWTGALDALLAPADPAEGISDGQADGRALYLRRDYANAKRAFSKESRAERRALAALASGAAPKHALLAIEGSERSFFLTAFQSAAFNIVLEERIKGGALGLLVGGDLAFKHDSRAVFGVTADVLADPATAERLARFEISPSGPMWGADMIRASGGVEEIEVAALASLGVSPEDLRAFESLGGSLPGERKPLRVPLTDPEVEGGADEHGPYVRCAFDLPRGAFATSVMEEVMKADRSGAPMIETEEE